MTTPNDELPDYMQQWLVDMSRRREAVGPKDIWLLVLAREKAARIAALEECIEWASGAREPWSGIGDLIGKIRNLIEKERGAT